MFCNFVLADFIARLNIGSKNHLRFIIIKSDAKIILKFLTIFVEQGIISCFNVVKRGKIKIYYKYIFNQPLFKEIKIISRPGHRIYKNVKNLNKTFSYGNFSGFMVVSTSIGLVTTNYVISNNISGEVLLKVKT